MNPAPQDPAPLRRILFCTDFSANADLAFELAVDTALHHPGATLTLLHVLQEPEAQFWKGYIYEIEDADSRARAEIDRKIDETYRPRVPAALPFQTVYRVGNPAQVILDYAHAEQVDWIVLGRQGRGSIFFGNVASRVARHARCPTLIVPMAFAERWASRADSPRG